MPIDKSIKKVLVIGSGPIVIGQAAEFDYAGAQACRVLKEAGVNVVLINSNPATIMTDKAMADEIYLEPLTEATLERIIEKERPDSLLAGLGGQAGLTLATKLWESGFLKSHGVKLIGTNVEAIEKAEDRQKFKDAMRDINIPTIPSGIAGDVKKSLAIAEEIGYPVIVRPAYTLGGAGGGVAENPDELKKAAHIGLDASPICQILVERYIYGWKEIEFEVMRDRAGNCIAVCSMENIDPVGVHTGDSIVVAPALTLSPKEYLMLKDASLKIIESLGIYGGCNCQFALDPESLDFAVIEVNPRVSRSSALASKATCYPIAKVTTKIALGLNLDEITNDMTGKGSLCFEPNLDYVVVKLPKWPFDKFTAASRRLGTQMKATGEVMALAASFEAALLKAVRGAEISLETLGAKPLDSRPVRKRLEDRDDRRIFTIFEALKAGVSVDEINKITRIDRFFINSLKKLCDFESRLRINGLDETSLALGKEYGYTDSSLREISGETKIKATPAVYKAVDNGETSGGRARYFYSAYGGECESRKIKRWGKDIVIVLGSGPIRIGQGIEFDYSSVHCVWALKQMGYEVVIINNNPETVSTDYDTADRLYFEPLTPEDVMNVIDVEKPLGVVVAFGGQTAIKLTKHLDKNNIRILGTSADGIDLAEDRERFDALLEKFGITRPKGCAVKTLEEANLATKILGYPVLLRPSYVIGGQGMTISRCESDTKRYMNAILAGGIDNPVLIDKYMPGTELEVDVISDGEEVLIPGIMEHIERAGVHSGDSIAVYPPFNISGELTERISSVSRLLALAVGTKGLVNIQYLIYGGEVYVIEVNPRASRTVPYISKVTGLPLVEIASRVMLGATLGELGYKPGLWKTPPFFTVKVPVFSFEKITDADTILGPEMKSTGEVLGIGRTKAEALYKGLAASGLDIKANDGGEDKERGILISVEDYDHSDALKVAEKFFDLGINLYATPDTAKAIRNAGLEVTKVGDVWESDDIYQLIESGRADYILYTGEMMDISVGDFRLLNRMAMEKKIPCMTSIDTALALGDILASRYTQKNTRLINITELGERRG